MKITAQSSLKYFSVWSILCITWQSDI